MKRNPQLQSFQLALRTFLNEAFGNSDMSRDFALTETPRGIEKLCFGLSCIDSGFRENTAEFSFRQMSRELHDFLSGPVSAALMNNFASDQFWVVSRKQKGNFEQATVSEVVGEHLRPMHLVIFNSGHDWVYVNEFASIVYLSSKLAHKVRT